MNALGNYKGVIVPYAFVGIVLLGSGYLFEVTLARDHTEHETHEVALANLTRKSIFEFPHLIWGVSYFSSRRTQVIAIDTIIGYANSMGIDLLEAKVFLLYTICNHMWLHPGDPLHSRFISQ